MMASHTRHADNGTDAICGRFPFGLRQLALALFAAVALFPLPSAFGDAPATTAKEWARKIEIGGGLEKFDVKPGEQLQFVAADARKRQMLTLVETASGAVWFHGKAGDLDLHSWVLRARSIELLATFADPAGTPAGEQKIVVEFEKDADSFYPGVLAQVIRRQADTPPLPPAAAFAPPAGAKFPWLDPAYQGYPPFRTAESIYEVDRKDPSKPRWSPPSYFHSVVPSFDLAESEKNIVEWSAPPSFPLGDLHPGNGHAETSGHLSAELLVSLPGKYEFKLESAGPARLEVAGGTALSVNLPGGMTPIAVTVDALHGTPQAEFRVLWKTPGSAKFEPIPAGLLVHRVSRVREQALATFTSDFGYRNLKLKGDQDDQAAVTLLASFDPAQHVENFDVFASALDTLIGAFTRGRKLQGDVATATAALRLVQARMAFLLTNRDQLRVPGFGKTDGRQMRKYEAMRAFLVLCERHPALQTEALSARASFAAYASATCLSRSFFSETHSGTNDGYGDDHNLLVNFWRAAGCLDDPYAWDAATCLMDSHFRYASGAGEDLGSDGIFDFHNANGRQIHMGGYGHDWFWRVIGQPRTGTPWGYTPEQYRRLAEYPLSYEWMLYQGTSSFQINGRHNSHRGDTSDIHRIADRFAKFPGSAVPEETRQAVEAMRQRVEASPQNSIQGNRFFYRNLFMVHRRKDFYIDVKMIAPGVGGPETFAGAFPWNMSFGDGVTTLMRDGKEYDQIHRHDPNSAYVNLTSGAPADVSLWHYRSLPGTTQLDDELSSPDRYRGGSGSAAGGVSDGSLGHCAFHFANSKTGSEYQRFYGFTEDGMVVLTNSIDVTKKPQQIASGVTMRSNLNQCDWRTDVKVTAQNGSTTTYAANGPGGSFRLPLTQRYFIEHDGICYLVLPTGSEAGPGKAGTLELDLIERTPQSPYPGWTVPEAKASALAASVPATRKARIFYLSIDHGRDVKGGQAAWFVCMSGGSAKATEWLRQPPVEILANTAEVQAMADLRDGVTHAFFRKPCELKGRNEKLFVSISTPASIMWNPKTRSLTVQDPCAACTHNTKEMADAIHATLGLGLQGITKPTNVTIPLPGAADPDDRYRGAPVTQRVN